MGRSGPTTGAIKNRNMDKSLTIQLTNEILPVNHTVTSVVSLTVYRGTSRLEGGGRCAQLSLCVVLGKPTRGRTFLREVWPSST